MVGQYGGSKEEVGKEESMCRFHRPQQGLSKRSISPRIDQLVDATFGHPRMSFLDTFQCYHQILLALSNQEKIAFLIPTRNFHYKVMPFGLKNVGSTYQRMVTIMFESRLGRNMEAYIDDMVVKSKEETEHLSDLSDIFVILRQHKLHLNASKCSFGVGSGKFMGYMITHHRIKVNPDQIKAIHDLHPPWNPKEVQHLTGMTATLNRFISKFAEWCRPFFQLLHKGKDFTWSEECDRSFAEFKAYLAHPPILSKPENEEVLYAYVAVA